MHDATTEIDHLVERWENLREHGEAIALEELCRDRPELIETVRRKIDALLAFASFSDTRSDGARLDATVPHEINGYEILDVLGRGGMGVVYKARQPGLGRIVALKMILAAAHAGSELRLRFRREAEAAARLRHPGIVQIYEVGESPSGDYLAMEFVDGGSLADRLDGTPWKSTDAAALMAQIADAVQAAHDAGIVHRDLKPANVLLSGIGYRVSGIEETRVAGAPQNQSTAATELIPPSSRHPTPDTRYPKITDFGIAKRLGEEHAQTASGSILGTPSYMAPEQAAGRIKEIGPTADVYALGAILYELLVGRPPFKADTAVETIRQVIDQDPVPPARLNANVPRDLETIALKCLRKDAAKRYQTARELEADLRRFMNGEPILARPVGSIERAVKWAKRRPTAATLIGVSALALTVLIGGGIWYNARLSREIDDKNKANASLSQAILEKEKALDREKNLTANLKTELGRTERLYGEADQLTRWMLNDHLIRLSGLRGATTVQKQLIERLIAHLDRLTVEVVENSHLSGDISATDIAIAFQRLADVQGNPNLFSVGDSKRAIVSYDKSLAIRAGLMKKKPDDWPLRLGYAICLRKKAQVLAALGEFDKANELLNESLGHSTDILKDHPDDRSTRQERLQALVDLADLKSEKDKPAALELYRDVLKQLIEAFGDSPTDPIEVGQRIIVHSRIADMLEAERKFPEAMEQHEKTAQLVRGQLDRLPDDARVQLSLSTSLISLADMQTFLDKTAEAVKNYEAALKIRRNQYTADANSNAAAHSFCAALERLAKAHNLLKKPADAAPLLNEALELRDRLAVNDPKNVEYARSRWILHGMFFDVFMQLNRLPDAEQHALEQLKQAQAMAERNLSAQDWQGVGEARYNLAFLETGKLKMDATDAELIAQYQKGIEQAKLSVAAYDRIGKDGKLNAKQVRLRGAAVKLIEALESAIKQLKGLKEPPSKT